MIRIQSNIKGVIAQLQRFRALAPQAVQDSIAPARWDRPIRSTAQLTLEHLARNDAERALIPIYLEGIVVVLSKAGALNIGITAPRTMEMLGAELVNRVMANEEEMQRPGPKRRMFLPDSEGDLRRLLDEAILDFVKEEKDLSPEEMDMDPEVLAANLRYVLFTRSVSAQSKEGLARAIQEYIDRFWWPAYLGGAAPDVRHWLPAVLTAWRELFASQWPLVVRQKLAAAWRKSQKELL